MDTCTRTCPTICRSILRSSTRRIVESKSFLARFILSSRSPRFSPVLFLLFRVVAYEARDTSAASGRVRDVILVLYYTGRPTLPIWSRIGVVDVRSQWSKSIRSSEFNPRNLGDQWTISVHVCGLKQRHFHAYSPSIAIDILNRFKLQVRKYKIRNILYVKYM